MGTVCSSKTDCFPVLGVVFPHVLCPLNLTCPQQTPHVSHTHGDLGQGDTFLHGQRWGNDNFVRVVGADIFRLWRHHGL